MLFSAAYSEAVGQATGLVNEPVVPKAAALVSSYSAAQEPCSSARAGSREEAGLRTPAQAAPRWGLYTWLGSM